MQSNKPIGMPFQIPAKIFPSGGAPKILTSQISLRQLLPSSVSKIAFWQREKILTRSGGKFALWLLEIKPRKTRLKYIKTYFFLQFK